MVKIRLTRGGAKKRPFYRIVVAEATAPRDGRFIELVGTYEPVGTHQRAGAEMADVAFDRVLESFRRITVRGAWLQLDLGSTQTVAYGTLATAGDLDVQAPSVGVVKIVNVGSSAFASAACDPCPAIPADQTCIFAGQCMGEGDAACADDATRVLCSGGELAVEASSADTAAEVVATPVPERDRQAVAEFLNTIVLQEFKPLRRMHVGPAEPATRYDAGETA